MKNRSVTLSLLTATLFAVPAFAADAAPQGTPPVPDKGPPGSGRGQFIQRFDKNADGKLDDAERQAARDEMRSRIRAKVVHRFDQDGDGQLNEAEKAAVHKARKHFRHRMEHRMMRRALARMQAFGGPDRPHHFRGSGGFSHAGHRGFRNPAGPGARLRHEILQRFDEDKDGRLGESERAAARKAGGEARARFQEKSREVLARFDKDGDGRLGESERNTLRDAWEKFLQQQPPIKTGT